MVVAPPATTLYLCPCFDNCSCLRHCASIYCCSLPSSAMRQSHDDLLCLQMCCKQSALMVARILYHTELLLLLVHCCITLLKRLSAMFRLAHATRNKPGAHIFGATLPVPVRPGAHDVSTASSPLAAAELLICQEERITKKRGSCAAHATCNKFVACFS